MLAVVVDASHREAPRQLTTVLETLLAMDADQPALLVVSKADLVPPAELPHVVAALREIAETEPIVISSVTGDGLRDLRAAIDALAAQVVIETRANRPVTVEDEEGLLQEDVLDTGDDEEPPGLRRRAG
jgi:50S ribosomal subunit-associated GTPase HflX